jgi:hypothetical protein
VNYKLIFSNISYLKKPNSDVCLANAFLDCGDWLTGNSDNRLNSVFENKEIPDLKK